MSIDQAKDVISLCLYFDINLRKQIRHICVSECSPYFKSNSSNSLSSNILFYIKILFAALIILNNSLSCTFSHPFIIIISVKLSYFGNR